MVSPYIKFGILFVVTFSLMLLGIFFLNINSYDKNEVFHFYESKIEPVSTEKPSYVYFDDNIDSLDFLYTLFFIKKSGVKAIVIEEGFNKIKDNLYIENVNSFIAAEDGVFSMMNVSGGKGLKISRYNYHNNQFMMNNFLYFPVKSNFKYSNYQADIVFNNRLDIPPERKGVVSTKEAILNGENTDIFYKFDNKYLFTLPFLIYIHQNNYKVKDLVPSSNYFSVNNSKIYFDDKGMSTFYPVKQDEVEPLVKTFSEWGSFIDIRQTLIEGLIDSGIYTVESSGESEESEENSIELLYKDYVEQEKLIESVYNLDMQEYDLDSSTSEYYKEMTSQWISFRNSQVKEIEKRPVFILHNQDSKPLIAYEKSMSLFNNSSTLKKFYLDYLFIMIVLFLLIISVLAFYLPDLISIAVLVGGAALIFGVQFLSRNFLQLSFPTFMMFIVLIIGVIYGLLMKFIYIVFWKAEISDIYRFSVNGDFLTKAISLLRKKKWDFELHNFLATFMTVDISSFLDEEGGESEIEMLSRKNLELIDIVKKDYGVVNIINPTNFISYYGNPPIVVNHAVQAVESAITIVQKETEGSNRLSQVSIAIHSKYEWFKFVSHGNERYYSNFGSSATITSGMIKVSKKFMAPIVITDNVYKLTERKYKVRLLDRVRFKGITKSIRLLQVFYCEEGISSLEKIADYYHAGLKLFESKRWEEASYYFMQCLKLKEDDQASLIYLERCKEFLYVPPKEEWDVVYEID